MFATSFTVLIGCTLFFESLLIVDFSVLSAIFN